MKKRIMFVLAVTTLLLVGCGTKSIGEETKDTDTKKKDETKIGLIIGTGGLGDQSFNDQSYAGLVAAEKEYGVTIDYSEPQAVSDFETFISQYAQDGTYDLIIVASNEAGTALEKIATEYPDQKFSIVDTTVDLPNVKSILKDFGQMTFLNGYVAGAMTKDTSIKNINDKNTIGILLGMDIPVMQEAATGFAAGAKMANPDVDVKVGNANSFGDPGKAKEITKSMYDGGADIVLAFAGGSGLGVLNQAKESELYAMSASSDKSKESADVIVASAIERLDEKVTSEAKEIIDNTWKGGQDVGTIKNNYVGISFENSNVELPDELLKNMKEIEDRFKEEDITMPKKMDEIDKWLKDFTK